MRLDCITKIERFISDALLSSPQIPLGVNVLTLAGTTDEEGIAAMARSIVVRYVGSDLDVIERVPLTMYRFLNFELRLAAQSYLTESAHDYVIQMCAGAYNTLTNQVPVNTGSNIVEPFSMTSEKFEGISDSTHYVYTQNWRCIVQEINPVIALDPCVAWGNCSYLFPSDTVQVVKPGDVLYNNVLYSPVLPPSDGDPYDPQECGVKEVGDDLVYTYNEDEFFLQDWTTYKLVSTDTFDPTGEMLIVNIYDAAGDLYRTQYFSNCDGRKVIQIAGAIPNTANSLGGLVRSPIGNVGNMPESGVEALKPITQGKNGFCYTALVRTTVFADPTDPDAKTAVVRYGSLYATLVGTTLTVGDTEYIYVGGTPLGKAWIRSNDVVVLPENDYSPHVDCDEPDITDGLSDGSTGSTGSLP